MILNKISPIYNIFKKNSKMINFINCSQTKINKNIEKDMIGFFRKTNSGNLPIYLIKQRNLLKHAQSALWNFHNNLNK
jgi:hypothetical protein